MREIKFRAWDKEENKMWSVKTLFYAQGQLISTNLIDYENEVDKDIIPEHVILLQYTGLKDKNGKEIYEGNIVLTDEAGWTGKVIYNEGMFYLGDNEGGFSYEPYWKASEVIGNIHENPELLS